MWLESEGVACVVWRVTGKWKACVVCGVVPVWRLARVRAKNGACDVEADHISVLSDHPDPGPIVQLHGVSGGGLVV